MPNLTIEFDNEKAREHFVGWLCGQGEQNYWVWMEAREYEERDEDITVQFYYHDDSGVFFSDGVIRTKCMHNNWRPREIR